jgi:hypothetical protein
MGRSAIASLALALALALAAGTARADFVTVSYISEPGDFIGQGQTFNRTYTPSSDQFFNVTASPSYVTFTLGTVTGSDATNTFTTITLGTNRLGTPLEVGTYLDAERAPFASQGRPGLDVTFQNRGASTLTGQFTVHSVSFFFDASLGRQVLGSLDVSFEQHYSGNPPALFGRVVYQNSAAVPEPSSIVLCGVAGIVGLCVARRRNRSAAA